MDEPAILATIPRGSRTLTDHHFLPDAEAVKVFALGPPGPSGIQHAYYLGYEPGKPHEQAEESHTVYQRLDFQNGPIREAGVNGITEAALLAILIDHLRGQQNDPHENYETARAVALLEVTLSCLHERTRHRIMRGVEGTSQK